MKLTYQEVLETVGMVVDGSGVAVIVAGILGAAFRALYPTSAEGRYGKCRRDLGRAVLLGLELLVAGDIIRTVAIAPTMQNVGVLGAIVLIRTFLSFSLEMEVNGRWPWQPVGKSGVNR